MTARLSSLSKELAFDRPAESCPAWASNQHRLKVLVESLKEFFPQYYGVEWIKETARYAANLAQVDSQCLSQAGREGMTDWSQILESQPASYLRMIWTVDVCISKGRLPEERDFPSWLRAQLTVQQQGNPGSQEQGSQPWPVMGSTMPGACLNGDTVQMLDFAPPLAEFVPHQHPFVDGHIGAGSLGDLVDAPRPRIFEGLETSDGVFADQYFGRDLDDMDWTFFWSRESPAYTPPERPAQDPLAWDTLWLQ